MTTATAVGPRNPSRDTTAAGANLLDIENLAVRFDLPSETIRAVSGVSLTVAPSETFALVGESGSGKSVSMLAVMGLLPAPPAFVSGSIRLEGREIIGMPVRELKRIRGRDVAMVFQEPMSSLNPVHRVGRQIGESLRIHRGFTRAAARRRAIELLDRVGIPSASSRVDDYPHEFSGGMRQRAMIAMALACEPKLLIADEPTTALDVTIQAQILDLMGDLQREEGMAIILITHDLGVVARMADEVLVMYAGEVVEKGGVDDVFYRSAHPYTLGLKAAMPSNRDDSAQELTPIDGSPPDLFAPPAGCGYFARCPYAMQACEDNHPESFDLHADHFARCWLHHEDCDVEAADVHRTTASK